MLMRLCLALVLAALSAPALAGTLEGRLVTLGGAAWDDPDHPLGQMVGRTVKVDGAIEFGIPQEALANGLTVVPVQVEIAATRIELSYPSPAGEGQFLVAAFNGFILSFETECALFERVTLDRDFTTLAVEDGDIFAKGGDLYINLSGLPYGPEARLAVDLEVADCPLS